MHINSLKINNFKGFSEESNFLTFNIPNGEKGSVMCAEKTGGFNLVN